MKRLLCVLTMLVVLTPACAQESSMRIRCEMSAPKALSSEQPAQIGFTLINAGSTVVQILNWQTPFEGTKSPMFVVKRDGVEVDYNGPMFKRGAPRKEHYLTLKPGERRETKLNLAEGWEVGAPGKYTVEYSAELFDAVEGENPAPRGLDDLKAYPLSCNSVSFTRER